jgi:hypothetical protein
MICLKCGERMIQYFIDPQFLEGEFYYCSKFPEDHPWIWIKKNGEVIEKK